MFSTKKLRPKPTASAAMNPRTIMRGRLGLAGLEGK